MHESISHNYPCARVLAETHADKRRVSAIAEGLIGGVTVHLQLTAHSNVLHLVSKRAEFQHLDFAFYQPISHILMKVASLFSGAGGLDKGLEEVRGLPNLYSAIRNLS